MTVFGASFILVVFALLLLTDFAGWRSSAARGMAERNTSLSGPLRAFASGDDSLADNERRQNRNYVVGGWILLGVACAAIVYGLTA